MFLWLGRVTLDIIGLAGMHTLSFFCVLLTFNLLLGFDYDFSTLSQGGDVNELSSAFTAAFDTMNFTAMSVLRTWFPALGIFIVGVHATTAVDFLCPFLLKFSQTHPSVGNV